MLTTHWLGKNTLDKHGQLNREIPLRKNESNSYPNFHIIEIPFFHRLTIYLAIINEHWASSKCGTLHWVPETPKAFKVYPYEFTMGTNIFPDLYIRIPPKRQEQPVSTAREANTTSNINACIYYKDLTHHNFIMFPYHICTTTAYRAFNR